ncbi:hypothetical protein [Vibrio sp. F12]|uniref:hypothetical protein n=1 Tax=Vibrio sp. F12 TaxID=2070776 RepID=UPI001F0D9384|nr:hypothetical protein [Vibrio sp. F12]
MDKNKESPLPENHITPQLFVQHAWDMDFRISAADSAVIHSDFIKHASILADKEGIDVHYLDFSEYDTTRQRQHYPQKRIQVFLRRLRMEAKNLCCGLLIATRSPP